MEGSHLEGPVTLALAVAGIPTALHAVLASVYAVWIEVAVVL
jgi:hypothetical protein